MQLGETTMFTAIMTLTGARELLSAITNSAGTLYRLLMSADSKVEREVAGRVAEMAGVDSTVLTSFFESVKAFIVEHFGESGLYAAYIATAAIVIFVLSKLFKISFAILKLVVVPSVALAFAATFFLPYNFFHFLPVTVSLFSVLLLFRG